jgi:hypothetical protein
MYFYKNILIHYGNIWFEMDSMSIKYPKSLVENVTSVFNAERISQNT